MKAKCSNRVDLESIFFEDKWFWKAQKFCQDCPAKKSCLKMALSLPEEEDRYGVFGGTTPEQRRELRDNS